MTIELAVLAGGCILALVHIFAAGFAKTAQYGPKWNMGARDEKMPPPSPLVGRLSRAQSNYFETFPVVIALLLALPFAHLATRTTALGAIVWLGARIVYLPLYAAGIPALRSLVFSVSMVGIVTMLWPLLRAALAGM